MKSLLIKWATNLAITWLEKKVLKLKHKINRAETKLRQHKTKDLDPYEEEY